MSLAETRIPNLHSNEISTLKNLRLKHPKNVSLSYLNINSIRNKFPHLSDVVLGKIDYLAIAETKLDSSFPSNQFIIPGLRKPYRLDVSGSSGGLLVYVNNDIPSRVLKAYELPHDIQAIPIELNLRKSKWLITVSYTHLRAHETR